MSETNNGGYPVKNASYWKRQHDKIQADNKELRDNIVLSGTSLVDAHRTNIEQAAEIKQIKADFKEVMAENVLLRKALGDIIFNGAISPVWLAEQALNSTPQTAKVQAVLDAAIKTFELHKLNDSDINSCDCTICAAVREMEE